MIDLIVIAILILIIGSIVSYLVRAKKRGEKCIGCPNAKVCPNAKKCGSDCKRICNHKN